MKQFSGWSGYWSDFLNIDKSVFLNKLRDYCQNLDWVKEISVEQENAWHHEFEVMRTTLHQVLQETNPEWSNKAWISFEHELFGESGKRAADVNLILPSGELFLIEFKHKKQASLQDIFRAAFDLSAMLRFHSESILLKGKAYLVFSREDAEEFKDDKVICDIANKQLLVKLKKDIIESLNKPEKYDVSAWQSGMFIRQPGILSGTVELFFKNRLPNLKNEAAENITRARDDLMSLYEEARQQQKRYVVMVNGRPGAGKTLLGMTVVAELARKYKDEGLAPLFLSGNGPLIEVLRYTLNYYGKQGNQQADYDPSVIIESLINFKRQFKLNARWNAKQENYIFFDEAQRAWDHIGQYDEKPESELHLLLRWLKDKTFGVLVLLMGDGQAIHDKEMSTPEFMMKFNDAMAKHGQQIDVIMPSLHANYIQTYQPRINDQYYLKIPIRQHYTDKLDLWIESVLSGNTVDAFKYSELLNPYPLYLTQHKELAEAFAKSLKNTLHENEQHPTKFRMGWLESSRGSVSGRSMLKQIKTGLNQIGPWYVHQPDDPLSCCLFQRSATEFVCQGLELSLALLNWGNDLLFRNGQLIPQPGKRNRNEYTFGAYRVLLSRGKNGLIIKVDDDTTFEYLKRCGMKVLVKPSFDNTSYLD